MNASTKHRMWAGLNALFLLFTLVMNGLANGLPLNGKTTGELSAAYPNLFVPAGLTFSIWGLIYLLLLGFVGYQLVCAFRGEGPRAALDQIGPWFVISSIANGTWIVAWHWQRVGLALLLMLLIFGSLVAMYLRLGIGQQAVSPPRRALVHWPISIYLGWITVATIANVTAFLVDGGFGDLAPGPVFWTVAVMAVAIALAGLMIVNRRDRAFAGVVVWALLGILIKRRAEGLPDDDVIELTALVGMGLIGLLTIAQLVYTRRQA